MVKIYINLQKLVKRHLRFPYTFTTLSKTHSENKKRLYLNNIDQSILKFKFD